MTIARREIIDDSCSGVYHCVSRCARRAWLCGFDAVTGRDYSHRRDWLENRLKDLSEAFCVDVLGYAIMSNHMHLVLQNRPELVEALSDHEVAECWLRIYSGKYICDGADPDESKIECLCSDSGRIELLRCRLSDIGWFMKSLKEPLSRLANEEDDCKGTFWEGRYKCTRLVDESALLAALSYVDLNPVRGFMAVSPEKSDYTSVKCRCDARNAKQVLAQKKVSSRLYGVTENVACSDHWLSPVFEAPCGPPGSSLLPITFDQYLQLLDWTGRKIRGDKSGAIPSGLRPVLQRLDIEIDNWHRTVNTFGSRFCRIAGKVDSMKEAAVRAGLQFFRGFEAARQAFVTRAAVT